MAKKLKKEIYTLEEIGNIIYELDQKADAVRFRKPVSAYAAAKKAALKLGIEDINGKKRNKLIAARDAEAIISFVLNKTKPVMPNEPEEPNLAVVKEAIRNDPLQLSIFDLFQKFDLWEKCELAEDEEPKAEVAEVDKTAVIKEAMKNFIQARKELEAAVGCKIIVFFKDRFI